MAAETVPAQALKTDLFIGGEFVPSATGKRFSTTNPATGEPLADVAEAGREDLDLSLIHI